MGFSSPVGNLIYFVSNRPPLVVFTVCLAAFAVATYSLAYYIKRSENILDPDFPLDWNNFISHLAKLKLCLNGLNESESELWESHRPSAPSHFTPPSLLDKDKVNKSQSLLQLASLNTKRTPNDVIEENTVTVSLEVVMSLHLTEGLLTTLQNLSVLQGVIQAHQLMLTIPDEVVEGSSLKVAFHAGGGGSWDGKVVCLTLRGAAGLLPSTSSPRQCRPASGAQQGGGMVATFTAYGQQGKVVCGDGATPAHVEYTPDPRLSVYLPLRDRSLINLHLLHTSYFLFVLVLTLACCALVRGRTQQGTHNNGVHVIGNL